MKIDNRIRFAPCLAAEPHKPLAPIDAIRPNGEKLWRVDCVHVTKRKGRHVAIATDMRQAVVAPVELEPGDVEGIFPLVAVEERALLGSLRVDGAFPRVDGDCVPTHPPTAVLCLNAKRLLDVAKSLGSAERVVIEVRGGNEAIVVRACPDFGKPDRKGPFGVLMPIHGGVDCFPQGDATKPVKKPAKRRARK